ncbi:MAG: heavy metal translocating P-type ATPase [Succinivibrionaceae bacterium]
MTSNKFVIKNIHKKIAAKENNYYQDISSKFCSCEINNSRFVEFFLPNLNCPHCSMLIEHEIGKLEGVATCFINLINKKIKISFKEDCKYTAESFYPHVVKIVKKHEPSVEVEFIENETIPETEIETTNNDKKSLNLEKMVLVFGGILFFIGVCIYYFTDISDSVKVSILLFTYFFLAVDIIGKSFMTVYKGKMFDENLLMTIATFGAIAIKEYPEAVAVMFFYKLGEYFQEMALSNSKRAISHLVDLKATFANLLKGDNFIRVNPKNVVIGDNIIINPGEKVPLDGEIIKGESFVNTTVLSGESVPKKYRIGDTILSGSIVVDGQLYVKVTKEYKNSTVKKIIDLVENASSRKSIAEHFISKFARFYTPIVVFSALILAFIPPFIFTDSDFSTWLNRAFVFLVISCPCALVISVPLTFFGGIGAASKNGVLIKGSNYLEALNNVKILVCDKTGTLTKGTFKVTAIVPNGDDISKKDLLKFAYILERYSSHPIAKSIVDSVEETSRADWDKICLSDYKEIGGKGVIAILDGKKVVVGNDRLLHEEINFYVPNQDEISIGTVVYIAFDNRYLGYIVVSDELRDGVVEEIKELRTTGIQKVVMLTGDQEQIAKKVAQNIGIDDYHAQLLPADKVAILESIQENNNSSNSNVAFIGDGINDAPVLARADIGIAMGKKGVDIAVEAADVVLMSDDFKQLSIAINIAKKTHSIVIQNIYFSIIIKVAFLILGALGFIGLWLAIFGDVGVMIIAILNSMRILYIDFKT